MITVVGAGPRGLSAALIAISKGKKVTLIDPEPFSTWQTPQTLPDFEMRSPITFDLVTGAGEDLQIYSLAQFLNRDIPYSEDQRTIESCSVRATRSQFTDYLQHVFNLLLPQVTYLKDPVVSIKPDRLITNYH
jgi:lysine/ornithine N-monooxygenase